MNYTIGYSEKAKGFTSFFDFAPEFMLRLGNNLYAVKDGQLHRHHDSSAPRNNFYGTQYSSRVIHIFNDSPKTDKIFQTLFLEGSEGWDVTITTNLTQGSLVASDFNQRDSKWYSPLFGDITANDLKGRSAQGIGNIQSSASTDITFATLPSGINIGNDLYQVNGSASELIGTITAIDESTGVVTVNAITTSPVNGLFAYAKKSNKYEGGEIRGYYLQVDMVNDSTTLVELFAINTRDIPSYV